MMFTGKQASAGQVIHQRARITTRDENTLAKLIIFRTPSHSYPMRGVFAADPNCCGKERGADVFKANQTYPCDRFASVKLRLETLRKRTPHQLWIDSKITQDATPYDATDLWNMHGTSSRPPAVRVIHPTNQLVARNPTSGVDSPTLARDVGIVGCGFAGCATGILLARAGHQVTIYERAPHP